MLDTATLGVLATMIALNMTMLGLVLRQMTNGKPKKAGNPQAIDPDDTRLGDVSVAYFREQFVAAIIKAIEDNR